MFFKSSLHIYCTPYFMISQIVEIFAKVKIDKYFLRVYCPVIEISHMRILKRKKKETVI